MYREKIELIKPIIYPKPEQTGIFQFGQDNRLYRSLIRLFEAFIIQSKKELYLVGGCVRDLLLGKIPKDYDLCTNAMPKEAKKICENLGLKTFDSGIKHGTITVIDEFYDQSYELTSFRKDGKYTDGRHPDTVTFGVSLEEDLKRRDFTINSFAYDFLKNELIALDESYFNDLEYGIIRTVGDPAERYEEDALRMLRALRFSAQLNFTLEKYTFSATKMCAPLLAKVSKERIRDELTKILLSDNPQILELICNENEPYLFDGITPITDMLKCEHQNPWHYTDVFHHTMDVIKRVPKTFELRWAALLHDIGKPVVKALKPGTTDHYRYIGHPEESFKIANNLMEMLKFSNEQKEIIGKYVLYHDYPFSTCSDKKFKQKLVEIGEDNFKDFIKLIEADGLAHKLEKSISFAIEGLDNIKHRYHLFISSHPPMRIRDLAINGDDIVKDGFLQGKEIGECLKWMLNIVLEHPEYNTKEKLLEYLEKYKEMSFQSS